MKRVMTPILLFSGLLMMISGLMIQSTFITHAQSDEDREFMGLRDCNDCHRDLSNQHELTRHGMTLLEVEADADPEDLAFVLADFSSGDSVRAVSFADGERPFTLEDVAFTLGTGKNYQAYVTELDNNTYAVLPAIWNTTDNTWEALELAESWQDAAYNFGQQCAGCHTVGLSYDPEDERYRWEEDGVQCEACHGPGSLHVDLADEIGFEFTGEQYHEISGALDNPVDAQVCGTCHIRGVADDGIHPYSLTYQRGDTLTDSFAPVASDDNDYWYADGYAAQSNMQYNEWVQSGHADSLNTILDNSAAETACLMCHSGTYSIAQQVLIETQNTDPLAFETAPLILRLLEEGGLSPSKQKIMLKYWLPLVLTALQEDVQPEIALEDLLPEIFDVVDFRERDYDPEAPMLPQFVPYLADFIIDAEEDAIEDGDTDALDEIIALLTQLTPYALDDILAQDLPISEAVNPDIASHADHFGVTCTSCHVPHQDEAEALALTAYQLCTSCHQGTTVTETVHHPVKEMFEGQSLVETVAGIPSTHFAEDDGPTCTTCHMSDVLMDNQTVRANHTWNPVLPSDEDGTPPSACSDCHTDLTTTDLRALIEETQDSVQSRLSLAWARVATVDVETLDATAADKYQQAVTALTFVQNDGSRGIHNYAYADALLDNASNLLSELSASGSNIVSTEAPAPTATASASDIVTYQETLPITSGMRPITLIIIVGTGLLLVMSAGFIYRRTRQTTSERDTNS